MKSKTKILIVEDEPIIASDIEMILESLDYEVSGIAEDAKEALSSIANNPPDLVLLDINLEGDIDGILLAQDINEKHQIPFIYLTSNTDKLTINRVKRTHPAGFIVKPFTDKDLQSNIEIALFQKAKPTVKSTEDYIFIKDYNEYIKLNMNEVLFIKAEDNYSRFFTEKQNYILSQTLKKVSEKLPDTIFVRIHRSFVVNMKFIDKYKEGAIYIKEHKLPIGRSYQESFFARIKKF